MTKKLRNWRVLSCTVAVLATIAFIVACGDGVMVDVNDGPIGGDVRDSETYFGSRMPGIKEDVKSWANMPSSAEEESSSSAEDNDGGNNESSSDQASTQSSNSNSNEQSSSSNNEIKSSSSSPYKLTCSMKKTTINTTAVTNNNNTTAQNNAAISEILTIECKENGTLVTGMDLENHYVWTNTKDDKSISWSGLKAGTDYAIKAKAMGNAPGCKNIDVICGNLTVSGGTSSAGNTGTTSSASNNTGTSSSSKANSSSSSSASNNNNTSSASGNYCFIWEGDCHLLSDDCADGVKVSSCTNPGVDYCDFGVCTGSKDDGWGCTGGGCYLRKGSSDACTGGSILSSPAKCPNDHLPEKRRSSGSTGGTSSSSGGNPPSGNTIDLTNATNSNWNQVFNTGSYTVIKSTKSQCALGCNGSPCSLTGAIVASSTDPYGSMSNINVNNGAVTISGGSVKFYSCW